MLASSLEPSSGLPLSLRKRTRDSVAEGNERVENLSGVLQRWKAAADAAVRLGRVLWSRTHFHHYWRRSFQISLVHFSPS